MGGAKQGKNIDLNTPEQQQFYSQAISQLGPDAIGFLQQILQPKGPEDYQDVFQQSYVDPAMQMFNQQIMPAIQERFSDSGASGALNQALAQGAKDLSTSVGAGFGQFLQGQQQNQLGGLSQFGQMAGRQSFAPHMQQQQGLLAPLLSALTTAAGGMAMSSQEVKENIRDYKKGLDVLKKVDVKQYDYKEEFGGEKNKVGVIAEDMPKEVTAKLSEILNVDVYGLLGIAINAIKELSDKVEKLEAR